MGGSGFFGKRGVTKVVGGGQFHCPTCDGRENYSIKKVERYSTVLSIPLRATELLGEYVECQRCMGTYPPEAVHYDPYEGDRPLEAAYFPALRRTMVMMMLADGLILDEEVETIRETYSRFSLKGFTPDEIRVEAERIQNEGMHIVRFLQGELGHLNDWAKELIVRAAFFVAVADGTYAKEEQVLLRQVCEALELPPGKCDAIVTPLLNDSITTA